MRGICKLFLTINNKSPEPSNEIIRIIFYAKVCNIMSDADYKSREASIILFPTLIDKSPDTSNELIWIIFYTKVCNIISDAD